VTRAASKTDPRYRIRLVNVGGATMYEVEDRKGGKDVSLGSSVCIDGGEHPMRFFNSGEAQTWIELHGDDGWRK
jgi:hypothetical protein